MICDCCKEVIDEDEEQPIEIVLCEQCATEIRSQLQNKLEEH